MTTSTSSVMIQHQPRRNSLGARVPVALLVVAGLTLGIGVVRNAPWAGGGADALPSPEQMAALGGGRDSAAEIVELWDARVDSSPESSAARAELAQSLMQLASDTGDLTLYAEAETEARAAVDLDPTSEPAALALAAALAGQHDFTGAADLARGVLDRNQGSVGARLTLGDASLELGDYETASILYSEVASEVGAEPPVLSRIARLRALTGDIEQARVEARAALVAAGEEDFDLSTAAFYWFQLATYEFQTGRYDDAQSRIEAALSIQPDHLGSTELLGSVLIARGELGAATGLYEGLIERAPAADLHGRLADLYRADGRIAEAEEQIALGLAVAAAQADAFPAERRHLIGFYADHQPARAVELAQQDLGIRRDVASYGWLGWALLQDGQVESAAELVDEMLAHDTEDAWLLYQAGSILAAAGHDEQAATLLDQALDLNPRFDLVHAARAGELLDQLRTT